MSCIMSRQCVPMFVLVHTHCVLMCCDALFLFQYVMTFTFVTGIL